MVKLILLLFVSCFLGTLINGQICANVYQNMVSPNCTDPQKPYCIQSNSDNTRPQYNCAECVSDCDCSSGQYCSGNTWLNLAGTCQSFGAEGIRCFPMSYNQLYDSNIPSTYKCADIVTVNNSVVYVDGPSSGTLSPNKRVTSLCQSGTCRACDAQSGSYISWTVNCHTGLREPRICALPGIIVQADAPMWRSHEYRYNPTWVWLAIYFPFFVIMLVTMCLMLWKKELKKIPRIRFARGSGGPSLIDTTEGYGKVSTEERS